MIKKRASRLVTARSPSTADLCPRGLLMAVLLHQHGEQVVGN